MFTLVAWWNQAWLFVFTASVTFQSVPCHRTRPHVSTQSLCFAPTSQNNEIEIGCTSLARAKGNEAMGWLCSVPSWSARTDFTIFQYQHCFQKSKTTWHSMHFEEARENFDNKCASSFQHFESLSFYDIEQKTLLTVHCKKRKFQRSNLVQFEC